MKRLAAALVALAIVSGAAQAQADPHDYGIESVAASTSTDQAGGHPDFFSKLALKTETDGNLPATTLKTVFSLPPGLLGNPNAVSVCTAAQLIGTDTADPSNKTGCPQDSQVGITRITLVSAGNGDHLTLTEPIFNVEPGPGMPARFGLMAQYFPVFIDASLRSDGDYGVSATVAGVSSLIPLLSAETTFWGVPADESHDGERITVYEATLKGGLPDTSDGKRKSGLAPVPLMRNPTRCEGESSMTFSATPYALPDLRSEMTAQLATNNGCDLLDFKPDLSLVPTTTQGGSSAGLDVGLKFPTDGWENPSSLGEADQRRVEVTLPQGLVINPSQAEGLSACSEADLARETASSAPNQGCPGASKIGSAIAKSPLLDEVGEGSLYVAKPYENPFHTLIAVYLVLRIPDRGVVVKLAGKVIPDRDTGQLVTIFDDIPQLPVESFRLHFREGARAPLVTPHNCGSYAATATFTSWAGQVVTTHPGFEITSGADGSSCPNGALPFRPGFSAGTLSNSAATYSPFQLRISRHDGDQNLTRFSTTLPPGLVAKLAGVSRCPDASIEAAKARAGLDELLSPSCPAGSEIGSVLAGAGVGPALTYTKGKVYLAGPYRGAPLSVAAIVPAVAGPFDVGTVVTREALRVNPRTAIVTADGESADPIPRILAGIPLSVRDIRVSVDRPDFTLNPTSCDPSEALARLWGEGADVFAGADDVVVPLSEPFQAANCASLGFRPRLSMRLKGASKRGGHPAFTGIYRPRSGDANLAGLSLRLPHSAFLDQAHIRTICTRVQFAAKACPAGAVYGHARAFSPLLDQPLEGPVYLRSSSHELPDLVADLHGLIDIEAVGRVDSVNGGIRVTFSDVPDAPIEKVVVSMQGAKKGLIVNSTDICKGKHLANAQIEGHNGKTERLRPPTKAECGTHGKRRR